MADEPEVKLVYSEGCGDCGQRRVELPAPLPELGDDFDWDVRDYDGYRLFMLEQWPADLVTVDLNMPVLDGHGFIKKAVQRWPDLPIVIVSGIDAVDLAVDALRLGAHDFITKPIESFSLVKNTIDKALESAELVRQNGEVRLGRASRTILDFN